MSDYKKTIQRKLRFYVNGVQSVEQLFNCDKEALIAYEEQLENEVEKTTTSRRKRVIKTREIEDSELRLAIVRDVLDTREADELALTNAAETKAYNQKILALVQNKRDEKLTQMSEEELLALLK
jgi:hypothetical protein